MKLTTTKPVKSICGKVSHYQIQNINNSTIWRFLLERVDSNHNPLQPVPIELRGSIVGIINDGDLIEVTGKWSPQNLMVPLKIYNRTTNSEIKFNQELGCLGAFFLIPVIMIVIMGLLVSFIYLIHLIVDG